MQKKKHRRVNFRINHCSSQDSQYPVTELLLQSPDAKGWQSKRFSVYPQILIIQLVEPTILHQISFLSHQSKISTRIQIETKLDQSKDWKKLGYVSLTSNQNTNYQTREFRTANLNSIPALFIKLTFKMNHINNLNVFNQVGLISLSFYGDKMVEGNFMTNLLTNTQKTVHITIEFDKQTMNKLKQLQIKKKEAVDNQQFDRAKSIKDQIDKIKNLGQTLVLLEQKKQQAIKKQDYEAAKLINQELKKLRDQNKWGPNMTTRPSGNPSEFIKKQQNDRNEEEKNQNFSQTPQKSQKAETVNPLDQRPLNNKGQTGNPFDQRPLNNKGQKVTASDQRPLNNKGQKFSLQDQRPLNNKGQTVNISDERPLNANGNGKRIIENEDRPLNSKGENRMKEEYQKQKLQQQQLEQLSKQILAKCQGFFSIIDEQIFKHLFSKVHKNRQNGIQMLKNKLNEKITNREGFIQAMLFAIKNVIEDKVASVLISVLELFDAFMKKLKPTANSNNLTIVEFILEKICDYLGHTNQKVVNVSQNIYSNLPVYQLTNKDTCFKCLTMVYKREKPPKIQAGRLKMICKIVAQYQLGKNYQQVIMYVIKYIDDKNSDVRTAACNAIVAISKEIKYSSVLPYLKNIRPQIIKSIEELIEGNEEDQKNTSEKTSKIKDKQSQNVKNSLKQKNLIQNTENEFIEMPKNQSNQQNGKICSFCQKFDQRFVEEDYIDLHYYHSCAMLTICLQCKQTIQISTLTSHLVGQCANSKYFKKCPRCKEAVHQKIFKTHTQKKQCLSSKPLSLANRCPLCHLDINPGATGWKEHLVDEGCENNPRK